MSGAQPDGIKALRGQIDIIDRQLVDLLNQRASLAIRIGEIKRRAGLPLYAPDREAEILDRIQSRRESGPLPAAAVCRLFERIIDESRSLERNSPPPCPGE